MSKLFALVGLIAVLFLGQGCTNPKSGDEIASAGDAIQSHAIKANPALRGQRLRVSGVIDGANSADGVCACLKVCDANGQNCTACSCSPANCGTCD